MNTDEPSNSRLLYEMFILHWKILFGSFGGLRLPIPYYMNLLNLASLEDDWLSLEKSLRKIDSIIQRTSKKKLKKAIITSFESLDWRNHLGPLVTIKKLDKEQQLYFIPILWKKLSEDGSWVKPQFLALLSIIDKDFIENCRVNLADGIIIPKTNDKEDMETFLIRLNEENDKWLVYIEWRENLLKWIND